MNLSIRKNLLPLAPSPMRLVAPRQLCMAFESDALQDLTEIERAAVVTQLANLLLQAAGQAAGDDHDEH